MFISDFSHRITLVQVGGPPDDALSIYIIYRKWNQGADKDRHLSKHETRTELSKSEDDILSNKELCHAIWG